MLNVSSSISRRPRSSAYNTFKWYIPSWIRPRDESESNSNNENYDGVKHWDVGFWTDLSIWAEGRTSYPPKRSGSGNCPPRPKCRDTNREILDIPGKTIRNENMYFLSCGISLSTSPPLMTCLQRPFQARQTQYDIIYGKRRRFKLLTSPGHRWKKAHKSPSLHSTSRVPSFFPLLRRSLDRGLRMEIS